MILLPPWVDYLLLSPFFLVLLVALGFLLNLAWEKFFNYLGRNEIVHEKDGEART